MKEPVYRIRPWGGGWGVFTDGETAAVEPLRTAADAVIHAKQLARKTEHGAQILVYGEDGSLMSDFFYERDAPRGG
jgi:hypothetical protein